MEINIMFIRLKKLKEQKLESNGDNYYDNERN